MDSLGKKGILISNDSRLATVIEHLSGIDELFSKELVRSGVFPKSRGVLPGSNRCHSLLQ
jgi:hypothetical protein